MKIKIFTEDENGKIVFTKKELEDLINEIEKDAYERGVKSATIMTPNTSYTYPDLHKTNNPPQMNDYICVYAAPGKQYETRYGDYNAMVNTLSLKFEENDG